MAVRYTPEMLERAAREAKTWDEAVRLCGGIPTAGSRRYLRAKMREAGIDASHIPTRWVRHSDETLRELVATSRSVAEVVRRLGISPVGGNQAHIGRRIAALKLDTTHFVQAGRMGRERPRQTKRDVLVLGSASGGRVDRDRLHRALLRIGVPEECAECGNTTIWNDRPLRLEIDHVNGDWWDNRPTNLRFLCPNCHAVTDTYRGRKRRATA
ncbi:hypothetical protein GCM10010329_36200 [Streptomyces spiroverticillatus]|uniref:HNH endonuclease n=1 Tax=Streptomyces finlayi TaxID=67296 RepID=A0A918WYF5_9ACTN|nr:HNH endonuclease [Streptomyces finlayi]GHA10269.1 hypothetical protein GCM10010329_36200 [Streptomyces spiroverticillatus]GHC95711.1 hypothetical protein GCM10010334_35410 [Streptomyces finlayi]